MITKKLNAISLVCVAILVSFAGCMVSPGVGEIVKKRSDKIVFEGFSNKPNQAVKIYALRVSDSTWIKIGDAKTSGSVTTTAFGANWYGWHTNLVVAPQYWRNEPGQGFTPFAELKATIDDSDLVVFDSGFYNYVGNYSSLQDLFADHGHLSQCIIFGQEP
jgi:hypothetical protein